MGAIESSLQRGTLGQQRAASVPGRRRTPRLLRGQGPGGAENTAVGGLPGGAERGPRGDERMGMG